jgi:hypothetical protein
MRYLSLLLIKLFALVIYSNVMKWQEITLAKSLITFVINHYLVSITFGQNKVDRLSAQSFNVLLIERGLTRALLKNSRLLRKNWQWTNTLAYFAAEPVSVK